MDISDVSRSGYGLDVIVNKDNSVDFTCVLNLFGNGIYALNEYDGCDIKTYNFHKYGYDIIVFQNNITPDQKITYFPTVVIVLHKGALVLSYNGLMKRVTEKLIFKKFNDFYLPNYKNVIDGLSNLLSYGDSNGHDKEGT